MKAPPDRAVRIDSRPAPQFGQSRGSLPSLGGGKRCGSSTSLIFSSTSVMRSSAVSSIGGLEIAPERSSTSL
jgi:hypothetical protein